MPDPGRLWMLADLATPWCLHVAVTLGIAEHISAGTTDIGSLAAASGSDREALQRVLRHLVSKGVFDEPSYPAIFGQLFWDDLRDNPRIAESFDALMGRIYIF